MASNSEAQRPTSDVDVLKCLLGAAAVVVILAGLRSAQSLVVPFLMASFLAVICTPALFWLQRKGVPTVLALLLVIAAASLVLIAVAAVVGTSISDFIAKRATYQAKLETQIEAWETSIERLHYDLPENLFDTQRVMAWFTGFLTSLSGIFGNAILVLLTLVFMLLEASGLPRKFLAMSGGRPQLFHEAERIRDAIIHYVSLKTTLSLLTGGLVALLLWGLGVDYPVLWGLLAFFFNFVPNIGSFIAAIPAILLALIQADVQTAVLATIGYVAINVIIGSFLEPRVMGQGLGLSTLVVFISLVFWGWVLGPVGILLSVPLTMIVKITLENFEQTRWLAILLSANPEPAS